MDPTGTAAGTVSAGTPADGATPPAEGAPAPATETPAAAEGAAATPPAAAAAEPKAKEKPPEPAPEPRRDVTARLAALSRQTREATARATKAEAAAAEAQTRANELDALLAKAKTDPSTIPTLLEKAGLSFETIVNYYAENDKELTPAEAQAKALAELRKEVDDVKAAKADEAKASAARAEQAAQAERVAGVGEVIKRNAEKFEICARLGEEAARDVFAEVVEAWNAAGRPKLEPGEYDDAVMTAAELVELRYEERGKKLVKAARAAAAPANGTPAANGAAASALTSDLPAGLSGGKLSDKDADILKGLIDRTAPDGSSQRAAKPRTINSALGGSAPPKTPARGSMDPRDALREVLAPFQRT